VIGAARWLPLSLAIHAAFGAAVWLVRDLEEPALFIDMRLVESDAPDRSESLRAGNSARPAAPPPRRSSGRSAPASALARDTPAASRESGSAAVREVAPPPIAGTPPAISAPSSAAAPPAPVAAVPSVAVGGADAEPSPPASAVAPAPPLPATTTPADTPASAQPDAGRIPALDPDARAGPSGTIGSLNATDTAVSNGARSAGSNARAGAHGAAGAGTSSSGGGAAGGGPLALAIPGDAGLGGYGPYLAALRRRLHEALEYPATARRRGLTGTVELEIALEATGRVNDVRVVRSSSHAVLDAAALEAARSLGRVPFPPDIRPRPLRVLMPVVFELR
jgi:protein TonB